MSWSAHDLIDLGLRFPLFIGWALLLRRVPRATPAMLAASTGLLAVFSGMWAMWTWVA